MTFSCVWTQYMTTMGLIHVPAGPRGRSPWKLSDFGILEDCREALVVLTLGFCGGGGGRSVTVTLLLPIFVQLFSYSEGEHT